MTCHPYVVKVRLLDFSFPSHYLPGIIPVPLPLPPPSLPLSLSLFFNSLKYYHGGSQSICERKIIKVHQEDN